MFAKRQESKHAIFAIAARSPTAKALDSTDGPVGVAAADRAFSWCLSANHIPAERSTHKLTFSS